MKNENIKFPCDRNSDPLTSVKVVSNGNIQIDAHVCAVKKTFLI